MTEPLTRPSRSSDSATAVRERTALRDAFADCRARTLDLYDGMDDHAFRSQIHPGYSPLGWHLGHIAYTEAYWLVHRCGGRPLLRPDLEKTFHVDGLPKAERGKIPTLPEVLAYLADVRNAMVECLEVADIAAHARHYWFVLQHECQHAETVELLTACRDDSRGVIGPDATTVGPDATSWVDISGGRYAIGSAAPDAMDNEQPPFEVDLAPFSIAARPVTQAQYAAFAAEGGYDTEAHWTEAGWRWRQAAEIAAPRYWVDGSADAPVSGLSAYEAEAWCNWAGVRLPTEFEWEAAAALGGSLAPLAGGVWQWTSSTFEGYQGFSAWPYSGYSEAYFDGRHRVLRGGSHVTRLWATRPSFRNWYAPDTRELFAGLRPVQDYGHGNDGAGN